MEGQVIGQCQQHHTHAECSKFLRKIDRETPKSHLTIDDSGAFVGSVSGGCIEGAVGARRWKRSATANGGVGVQRSVSDEQAWDVGLACGGTIRIYVEPVVQRDLLHRLLADFEAKQAVARVTRSADGAQVLVRLDAAVGDFELTQQALAETRNLLACGCSERLCGGLWKCTPDTPLTLFSCRSGEKD